MSGADTIFALASGVGRAGIAILRISGDLAAKMLEQLSGSLPLPRRASLRRLLNRDGETLDECLVLWFPPPGSYTGEPCVELHLHGGPAVIDGVSEALLDLGARPAEPGEFTRRAFTNGRLDLTEAEAVLDLIEAETSAQRVQALRQLGGALTAIYEGWRAQLIGLLAQQEALIDFADEDLPASVEADLIAGIEELARDIDKHLDDDRRGERLRRGIVIVVTGPPNAGKSSLVNYLAKRDIAIVSPIPGTTRDALEARLILASVPVTLVDTAGLRETDDAVEAEGVRRARALAEQADIILRLSAATDGLTVKPDEAGVSMDECGRRELCREACSSPRQVTLHIVTKIDLLPADTTRVGLPGISLVTGEGLETLLRRLSSEVSRLTRSDGQAPLTQARHRAALMQARSQLRAKATAPELRGEDLRLALRHLGRVTGRASVEDILDQVFTKFCIGK